MMLLMSRPLLCYPLAGVPACPTLPLRRNRSGIAIRCRFGIGFAPYVLTQLDVIFLNSPGGQLSQNSSEQALH
jgi:hypothetical protein